jgi:fumarate reductase subunit C
MVWGLKQLSEGPAAWAVFLEVLRTPEIIVFHVLALGFAAYHSITWFNLTPKALPLQIGEDFVPGAAVAGAHFAAWAALSLAVLYLAGAF